MPTAEQFWNVGQWRVARKDHACGDCGRTIEKAERYFDTAELVEPPWLTLRLCADCAAKPVGV